MDQALYLKLRDQIARQTPEADALEAQAAALQSAIDSAQAWLDSCEFSLVSAQALLTEAQAVEGADTTVQQEAVNASQSSVEAAKTDLAKAKAPQDEATAHAKKIRDAIAQCQAAMDASGVNMTTQEAMDYELAQSRAQVWERIKAHRDAVKSQGVQVAGKWYHSDADSRIQQLALVMMGASVPPVAWKTMDGTFVTMSQALAGQIFQATATRDMAVFSAAEQHRAAVNASTAPAAYDFSAGWPAGFVG